MADLSSVYSSAVNGFLQLKSLSVKERIEYITHLKHSILENLDSIVKTLVDLTHKDPFEILSTEIFPTLTYCSRLEKNAYSILKPKTISTPLYMFGKKSKIYLSPKGVSLIISPWNFPFYLAIVPTLTSFVCGNSVILKPSEHTSLTGFFENLFNKSGFLKDWINICYGDGQVASDLIDLKPDMVFFTGSSATGKKVAKKTSLHLIPTILELGGKDALIICNGVNLKKVAQAAAWGSYANSGQICTSTENIFVQEEYYDKFKKYFVAEVKKIQDFNCIFLDHHRFFLEKVFDSIKEDPSIKIQGNYKKLAPCFTENVSVDSSLFSKEVFGPLVNLIKFKNDSDLIDTINNLGFGLSASIWTSSLKRQELFINNLNVANISINNVMVTHENPALPFGGIGLSGYGRYKGKEGLISFSNIKSVVIDKSFGTPEPYWFPYNEGKYQALYLLIKNMLSSRFSNRLKSIYYAIRFFLTRYIV